MKTIAWWPQHFFSSFRSLSLFIIHMYKQKHHEEVDLKRVQIYIYNLNGHKTHCLMTLDKVMLKNWHYIHPPGLPQGSPGSHFIPLVPSLGMAGLHSTCLDGRVRDFSTQRTLQISHMFSRPVVKQELL